MKMLRALGRGKTAISGLLLTACILCSPAASYAGLSVSDTWEGAGKLSLEYGRFRAVFAKEQGGVCVYDKDKPAEMLRIVPFSSPHSPAQATISCVVEQNRDNEASIRARFSAEKGVIEGFFRFDDKGAIRVAPSWNLDGISLSSPIRYGIVPGRILDDVIYDPAKYPAQDTLHLPSEHLFMGLLEGEGGILVCAWPEGNQRVRMLLENGDAGARRVRAVELDLDGRSAFLEIAQAPGIWHAQKFLSSQLEKDVELDWKRPFSAKWKTQLYFGGEIGAIETAFPFRKSRADSFMYAVGEFPYPVWFDGDKAFFHLTANLPPRGEALVYALEGRPDAPVEFAEACVGDVASLRKCTGNLDPIPLTGIRNCNGRHYLERIFEVGLQTREKKLMEEMQDDFDRTARVFGGRIAQYDEFVGREEGLISDWKEKEKGHAAVLSFLDAMLINRQKVEDLLRAQTGNQTGAYWLQHELDAIKQTRALFDEPGAEVLPEAKSIFWESDRTAGFVEHVPGCVGGLAREWAREAAYKCADNPGAVKYAEAIRETVRECIGHETDAEVMR